MGDMSPDPLWRRVSVIRGRSARADAARFRTRHDRDSPQTWSDLEYAARVARKPEGLKVRREQLGYTQESAAEALGVAVSSYKCWEQGVRTPRVGFRPKLAREF